jgi:predicted hydrocarbon binding protein
MVDESVTVKGSPVRSLQKFIEDELAPAERDQLFANVPPEYAARFRTPVLATESVPIHMLNVVTEEAAKAKGEPLERFAERAGRAAAGDAVKGIYRFFALVLTPPALLSKASAMWSTVYNRGQFIVADQTEHSARIRLSNFPSEVAGCARISGWMHRMAEMTGVKEISVRHNQCAARGAKHCEWELTWR